MDFQQEIDKFDITSKFYRVLLVIAALLIVAVLFLKSRVESQSDNPNEFFTRQEAITHKKV